MSCMEISKQLMIFVISKDAEAILCANQLIAVCDTFLSICIRELFGKHS